MKVQQSRRLHEEKVEMLRGRTCARRNANFRFNAVSRGLTNVAFWIIGRDNNFMSDLRVLASHATQRGRDLVA